MIALDASVAVKWFKPHERFEAEAQSLLDLIGGFKVEALASEWLSLEVVRGLKRAQREVPALAISDEDIHAAYEALETLFRSGALLEVSGASRNVSLARIRKARIPKTVKLPPCARRLLFHEDCGV